MKFDKKKLVKSTKKIFKDSLMPNSALVAAPVHTTYYPKEATNYMYIWPGRDAGFSLAAMLLIGEDHYEKVLSWIWTRAEDFQHSDEPDHEGLLFRNYFLNGRIYLHYLQPDQNGTLLWSINFKHELIKKPLSDLEKKVTKKAADALVRVWDKDHFTLPIEDLWEERGVQPKEGILTYSLATCAQGLKYASNLLKNELYHKISKEMGKVLEKYCWDDKEGMIPRRFHGSLGCESISDASLAGLVWPFNTGFKEEHLIKTVEKLEKDLVTEYGIHRYPEDKYEGSLDDGHNHTNQQAGAWPLLTFWLSIAFMELDDKKKAEKYFDLVFKNLEDYYIPEQFFCCHNVPWTGVKPLLWSHTMAIIAAWKLGKL